MLLSTTSSSNFFRLILREELLLCVCCPPSLLAEETIAVLFEPRLAPVGVAVGEVAGVVTADRVDEDIEAGVICED